MGFILHDWVPRYRTLCSNESRKFHSPIKHQILFTSELLYITFGETIISGTVLFSSRTDIGST
ncbi:hypothetical protein M378DRAFT_174401 [Amanita muscaria Koide BX008]|uniref:Uncharacterized protein n=1 Tax=Amanita muscaria (strain Koide BX008) TaxID=946122 RepID=A0A0C2VZA9_AMAMK|nr:hypothetical protein M378DRAFT_174401 [Amanita muscaria Koide BX008]